jgi:glucose-1-phosphate cytidylyltransferase
MRTSSPSTVVILCGGRGTRLQEHTQAIPKPLVEIGGWPILWHVIQIYASQGFRRFILCLGYRAELIEDFAVATGWPDGVEVRCVRTGLETQTGGRIKAVADHLPGETFCVTYADGVADIDLALLCAQHEAYGTLATVTVIRPVLQFGFAQIASDGRIRGFHEKPRSQEWINGGFFCFEPQFLDYLEDDSILERGPLERCAADGQLMSFRHEGFWACMDTYKDALTLNDLWSAGKAPWRVWEQVAG